MNPKQTNPYESPGTSSAANWRFPIFTVSGVVLIVATVAAAVFMLNRSVTEEPVLYMNRGMPIKIDKQIDMSKLDSESEFLAEQQAAATTNE